MNPFEPNTTYYQVRNYCFDGGACGQDTRVDYLKVLKTTPHTITTFDGKRYKIRCGEYVKVGFTKFYFKSCKKEHPNKNKKAEATDESLRCFFKYYKKVKSRLMLDDPFTYLDDFKKSWGYSPDDVSFDEYIVSRCV